MQKHFSCVMGTGAKYSTVCQTFQVIDLLVRVLQFPLQGAPDLTHLTRVFKGAYDVLYTYMIGNSRKNALYFAKYIDFFQTQITVKVVCFLFLCVYNLRKVSKRLTFVMFSWYYYKSSVTCVSRTFEPSYVLIQGDIGLNVAKMIAELIRDNRKIVDRISQEQIELFVGLLKLNKVTIYYTLPC